MTDDDMYTAVNKAHDLADARANRKPYRKRVGTAAGQAEHKAGRAKYQTQAEVEAEQQLTYCWQRKKMVPIT